MGPLKLLQILVYRLQSFYAPPCFSSSFAVQSWSRPSRCGPSDHSHTCKSFFNQPHRSSNSRLSCSSFPCPDLSCTLWGVVSGSSGVPSVTYLILAFCFVFVTATLICPCLRIRSPASEPPRPQAESYHLYLNARVFLSNALLSPALLHHRLFVYCLVHYIFISTFVCGPVQFLLSQQSSA